MLCFAMAEWTTDVRSGDWLVVHGSYEGLSRVSVGSLPRRELHALAGLLARHTVTSTRCWFAVWEGFEALPARITDGVTFDSDRLNAELDDM
jgi:hypothetical protein